MIRVKHIMAVIIIAVMSCSPLQNLHNKTTVIGEAITMALGSRNN